MSDVITRLNKALEGRYRVERELGAGGMATVYLAEDLRHERGVALKVLRPELAAVVGAERFLAEIKTTANLQHPHILPLFDSGEADSFLFYVMPYVEGETLRERLDRERQLPVDEAMGIATAVAHALQAAHEQGVIHRDIKPGNILLSRGQPLVADFGIALAVGAAGGGRLTETGLSVGTPYYMSPEQATGDQSVGPATDTYALACVLYEMLIGDPPYIGSTAQAVLGKIIQGTPVSATSVRRAVPANVDAAIRKALEKVPADRFPRADDFAKALADPGFRHGEDAAVAPWVASKRWKRLALATSTTTVLLGGGLLWALTRAAPPEPVERFESPFSPGQAPLDLSGAVNSQPSQFGLSPDGSMVVYVGPGGSGGALWVRRWDALDATPVAGGESGFWPTVSPDGRQVAFAGVDGIKVVDLGGGPVRSLTAGNAPRWADDGFIYYTRLGDPGDGELMRIRETGGTPELVSPAADGESRRILSQLLPGGGGALLAVQLDNGSWETHALDVSTGVSRRLVSGGASFYFETGQVVWVADGTLMGARFDPDAMELTGPPVPLTDDVGWASYSNTGRMVYATAGAGSRSNTELVWVTREGEATPVEAGWTFDAGGANPGWSLSPDGSRIALSSHTRSNDIWIKELPAGPLTRLTFTEDQPEAIPFWTPDGARVTYVEGDNFARVESSRADGTGTPELLINSDGGFAQGVWTPDGSTLVLRVAGRGSGSSGPGQRDIVALEPGVDDAPRPLVATTEYGENDPTISRDGHWLAYSSNETGQPEVFVRPFPEVDSGKWQVSLDGGSNPLWSHNGRELYYRTTSVPYTLVAAGFSTGVGFRVTRRQSLFTIPNGFTVGTGINTIDISPDDQRFLMGRAPGTGDSEKQPKLVLVVNFAQELEERLGR